eukprot:TRINITY_DN4717_c0_g1_i2.p1 TRINITY_DN4717_c0_g1~~TRINITY_DN4717_c0_g1_i2.p1  ORF type:complete len:540 (-),score=126.26 TRINITY_DN4717_c0_g1_i2:1-1620(-)
MLNQLDDTFINNRKFHDKVLKELIKTAFQLGCQKHELLSALILLPHSNSFSVENGCLNSSYKIKRLAIMKKFQKEIDTIYSTFQSQNFDLSSLLEEFKLSDNEKKLSFRQIGKTSVDAKILVNKLRTSGKIIQEKKLVKQLLGKDVPLGVIEKQIENQQRLDIEQFPKYDINLDSQLDPSIQTTNLPKPDKIKTVFITGATGFLGRYFLYEVLMNTDYHIICLSREKNTLKKVFNHSSLWIEKNVLQRRVSICVGELSLPRFGLPLDQYQELCERVDTIVHFAANVNLKLDYGPLRTVNVLGTLEIIRFATTCKLKFLHFASTTDVLQNLEEETMVYRSDIPLQASGYTQTKMVAENLIIQAQARGVPSTIYRIGNVFGDTLTGFVPSNDFFSLLLIHSILTRTIPPMGSAKANLTPVNFLSKVLLKFLNNPQPGQAFHIRNVEAVPLSFFQRCLEGALHHSIQQIPYKEWEEAIFNTNNPLRSIWKKSETGEFPKLGSKTILSPNYFAFLKEVQLSPPPLDESYFQKIILFLSSNKSL